MPVPPHTRRECVEYGRSVPEAVDDGGGQRVVGAFAGFSPVLGGRVERVARAGEWVDDLGLPVRAGVVWRVVSLVPSLTEAIACSAPGLPVGATVWCTHPAGLRVERVGGTKNPDVGRIVALAPDLVVANEEENRAGDLDALREAGVYGPSLADAPGVLAVRAARGRVRRAALTALPCLCQAPARPLPPVGGGG